MNILWQRHLALFLLIFVACATSPELLKQKGDGFEVSAPDQENLSDALLQTELAKHRLTRVLGKEPPFVSVLLFQSNKDLLAYDYHPLIAQKIHFLPWLTKQGIDRLPLSQNDGPVERTRSLSRNRREYPELGVVLITQESLEQQCVKVQSTYQYPRQEWQDGYYVLVESNKDQEPILFEKDDTILSLNSQSCNTLLTFDSLYSEVSVGAPLHIRLLRNQAPVEFTLNKSLRKKDSTWPEIETDLTEIEPRISDEIQVIAHEAGHVFFTAFVDKYTDTFHPLVDYTRRKKPFYGHPSIPDWLDEGMAIFCEAPASRHARILGLKQQPHNVIDLNTFVRLDHPQVKKKPHHIKCSDHLFSSLFYRQSGALVTYLFETAGSRFMHSLAIESAKGKTFESIIKENDSLPDNLPNLEKDFKQWLQEYE